jgi:hypothetical protein
LVKKGRNKALLLLLINSFENVLLIYILSNFLNRLLHINILKGGDYLSKDKDKNKSISNNQSEISFSKAEIKQFNKDVRDFNDAASALFRIPVFFSHQGLFSLDPLILH